MITQTIQLKIKADAVAEFEALVSQLMHDVTTNEPGSIYAVQRIRGQPLAYHYYLSFVDQASYDRYMAADYHTQMSPKAVALLDGDPVFADLDNLS